MFAGNTVRCRPEGGQKAGRRISANFAGPRRAGLLAETEMMHLNAQIECRRAPVVRGAGRCNKCQLHPGGMFSARAPFPRPEVQLGQQRIGHTFADRVRRFDIGAAERLR